MTLVAPDQVLVTWLAAQFPAARVCTETPADLLNVLPVIQVHTVGGTDPVFPLDVSTVDVDVFHNGSVAASLLAEQVRAAIRMQLPGQKVAGAYVADTATILRPRYVYYADDASLRRYSATYRIAARSL